MSNMLARFSRMPSYRFTLSSFAQSLTGNSNKDNGKSKYSKEAIDKAICEIKELGRSRNNSSNNNGGRGNETYAREIRNILDLMKKFEHNLHVQRVACHALSNLAMEILVAREIVAQNGFRHIKNSLDKFIHDSKLCWLASSAVWNMARPPPNREKIGKSGVQLMLQILSMHYEKHEKVTNTAIGALSNLSLCDSIKNYISKRENISLVLKVLKKYSLSNKSITVMTSGAGLIANLAVSDEHAATLLQYGALNILLQLLTWKSLNSNDSKNPNAVLTPQQQQAAAMEDTLHRNTCAALNNMVNVDQFKDAFLANNGAEVIYPFIKKTKNELFISLLENCLVAIECDVTKPTSTLHLCALYNKKDIIKKILKQHSFTLDKNYIPEKITNKYVSKSNSLLLSSSEAEEEEESKRGDKEDENDKNNKDVNMMEIDSEIVNNGSFNNKDNDSDSKENDDLSQSCVSVGSHIWGETKAKMMDVKELINQTDHSNMTPIQYAAINKHYDLIEFLVKCGANPKCIQIKNNDDDSNNKTEQITQDNKEAMDNKKQIEKSIETGTLVMKAIIEQNEKAISDALQDFPTDLCKFMVTFQNPIEMLEIARQY